MGGGGDGGGFYMDGKFELQMSVYYTNRGAHIYLAPGGNTPAPPLHFTNTMFFLKISIITDKQIWPKIANTKWLV